MSAIKGELGSFRSLLAMSCKSKLQVLKGRDGKGEVNWRVDVKAQLAGWAITLRNAEGLPCKNLCPPCDSESHAFSLYVFLIMQCEHIMTLYFCLTIIHECQRPDRGFL